MVDDKVDREKHLQSYKDILGVDEKSIGKIALKL